MENLKVYPYKAPSAGTKNCTAASIRQRMISSSHARPNLIGSSVRRPVVIPVSLFGFTRPTRGKGEPSCIALSEFCKKL